MPTIGLIPLDERPVNTRFPGMIADIAGSTVMLPPHDLLSYQRTPADSDAIADWLRDNAASFDALIVSIEMFGYGGLIASRTTEDNAAQVIERIEVLREIKTQHPNLQIYGFNVIRRTSRSNYNFEEPLYWAEFGYRLFSYSQLLDRQMQGQDVTDELQQLEDEIPEEYRRDFLRLRLRNHIVNLTVVSMLAQDVFDLLVISSDDTSEYGIATREKRWITEWTQLALGEDERLLLYPGADEVGCALLARALKGDETPKFAIQYAIPEDRAEVAPFEDGPIYITVERQVRAVGGQIVDSVDEADFIVAVNPPSRVKTPYFDPQNATSERENRTEPLTQFTKQIGEWVQAGKFVILADVAYPNGADPVLVDLLRENVDITGLAAYGAWNTAGNTTGTALAQGVAAAMASTPTAKDAQARFLLHRFVEDWGYQHRTREDLRDWLEEKTGGRDITPETIEGGKQLIERNLQARLEELPGFADHWRIQPGSIRLPWERTFEVDFDLEPKS